MKLLIVSALTILAASAGAQTPAAGVNECVRVTTVAATLRGKPSLSGKALDMVTKNTQLESITRRNAWVLVQSDDYAGWVESRSVEPCVAGTISNSPVPDSPQESETTAPESSAAAISSPPTSSESRTYSRGPKGGCYYVNSSGRKVYVNHNHCN